MISFLSKFITTKFLSYVMLFIVFGAGYLLAMYKYKGEIITMQNQALKIQEANAKHYISIIEADQTSLTQYESSINIVKNENANLIERIKNDKNNNFNISFNNKWLCYIQQATIDMPNATCANAINESTSSIAINRIVSTIVYNYGLYKQAQQQVKALQEFIINERK